MATLLGLSCLHSSFLGVCSEGGSHFWPCHLTSSPHLAFQGVKKNLFSP